MSVMGENGSIPAELAAYPGYLLVRLGESARQRFHAALAPEGLHPRHFGVMTMVAAHPGITQHRLYEKTAIDPSSMVAVIDELERMGLAERKPHPEDRRAHTIFLTEAGQEALERARTRAAGLQHEMFAALSAAERRTLHGLLRKLAGAPRV